MTKITTKIKRIRIIEDTDRHILEDKVNEFLRDLNESSGVPFEDIDVKVNTAVCNLILRSGRTADCVVYTYTIVYSDRI